MTKLSDHHSSGIVKLLLIGNSGTGKTGSMTSLVRKNKLHILDLDNGLDSLVQFVKHECPECIDNVDFVSFHDNYKSTNQGPVIDGMPKAFVESVKVMTKWVDGSSPADWGAGHIFVIDTLTAMGRAAFEWAKGLNPAAKDPRAWYFQAQQAVENIIAMLTSANFKSSVIVVSHIAYRELEDGTTKGFASAIGSALGPHLPKYFNTVLLAQTVGTGATLRRVITPVPTALIDLKTPVPFKLTKPLELGTALSTVFETLTQE